MSSAIWNYTHLTVGFYFGNTYKTPTKFLKQNFHVWDIWKFNNLKFSTIGLSDKRVTTYYWENTHKTNFDDMKRALKLLVFYCSQVSPNKNIHISKLYKILWWNFHVIAEVWEIKLNVIIDSFDKYFLMSKIILLRPKFNWIAYQFWALYMKTYIIYIYWIVFI